MHELTVPNRSYHIVVVTYTALSACTVAARPGEGIHNTIRKSVGCECILYYRAGSDVQRPFDHFCTCSPYKALGSGGAPWSHGTPIGTRPPSIYIWRVHGVFLHLLKVLSA